jgi:hypothetical protein
MADATAPDIQTQNSPDDNTMVAPPAAITPTVISGGGQAPPPLGTPTLSGAPSDFYNGASAAPQASGTAATTNAALSGNTLGASPASQPPAPQGQQSVWKNLVMGAIWGLAGSKGATHFGGGAAGGAEGYLQGKEQEVENTQRQQKLDADIKFQSLQAAHMAAESTLLAKQVANYDEDHQAEVFSRNTAIAKNITEMTGATPEYATANDSASETAALKDATAKNGGVAPYMSIQVGANQFLHFNLQKMAQSGQGLAVINDQLQRTGQPTLTLAQYQKLSPEQQIAATQSAATRWAPTSNPDKLQQMKNDLALIQSLPADAYKREESLATLNKAITTSEELTKNAATDAGTLEGTKEAAATEANPAKKAQQSAELTKTLQETINAKYANAENHQKALIEQGKDPETGETLNLSNSPDEMLVDERTGQPIPTKMLSTMKPTPQESNRADFANSTLHTLDQIDALRQSGKLPNGPLKGITAKQLIAAGMASEDAQKAANYISLAQSAATGAHVGGRFSVEILKKMQSLLDLNMNDKQFSGAEASIRDVMTQYTQTGGRTTVGQYKNEMIGSTKVLKNGQKVKITGVDKNGQFVGQPAN